MGVETELRHMEAIAARFPTSFGAHPDPLSSNSSTDTSPRWTGAGRRGARHDPSLRRLCVVLLYYALPPASGQIRPAVQDPAVCASWELERSHAGLQERLGIKPGETTPDQLFTLRQWNVWRPVMWPRS